MPVWQESLLLLVMAVVLALIVKTFLVQAFYIPSKSMQPGLQVNDRILVQKVSYWGSGTPQRGDVVVFEDPGEMPGAEGQDRIDWLDSNEQQPADPSLLTDVLGKIGLYPTGGHLVKRVIGVAGDTIVCCDSQGRLEVDGVPLDSSGFTLNNSRCDGPEKATCDWSAGPIPDGMLFVMGDHRDDSADSSYHLNCVGREKDAPCDASQAYVPVSAVVGKVFARVWPASRMGLVKRPTAFDSLDSAIEQQDQ
ncbi:signal peptidase I [Nocardioides sp. CBS4Y-1]|uniref:Signal peptidase I n=2 Tax=Nocardioides acrostichi TaxID=2784339 RepID=A0A930UU35_9ACTN|nr:signal peptidase I [Nocardioides acrostichi]